MALSLVEFLPVDGASVSKVGGFLGTETLAATDATIARIDELQFDLGEGPCWDAIAALAPVLQPDVRAARKVWPAFSRRLQDHGVTAIFAFPLAVGPLRIGAIDLYSTEPTDLDGATTTQTTALASIISRHVLRDTLRAAGDGDTGLSGPYSRRTIHQATGFVIAQCGISAEDAYLLLQGHAFAEGTTMEEIAQDVVSGRLVFTATGTTIGDVR
jgi:hypothetical protein